MTLVSVEATSLTFRCESAGLAGRVALHPQHMQSLHLQLSPLPDHNKEAWSADDLQVTYHEPNYERSKRYRSIYGPLNKQH